jgi:hypothetical protein
VKYTVVVIKLGKKFGTSFSKLSAEFCEIGLCVSNQPTFKRTFSKL